MATGNFELPRKDWYDAEGRIYKDALIENFNAIEDKLRELARLGESIISGGGGTIDTSDVRLDDVTLNSFDTKVINLRSFLTIMNLFNYPMELSFNGKKVVKCAYWNKDFEYIVLSNRSTNCNNTNKYIYLNYVQKTITSEQTATTPEDSILIGVYSDGQIRGVGSFEYININLLYYLARMSGERIYNYPSETGNSGVFIVNGRTIGDASSWHERGWVNPKFRDVGRLS